MTAVDVLGRVDELTDRTGGSVDAVMRTAIGPYRKSRIKQLRALDRVPTDRRIDSTPFKEETHGAIPDASS
jgi:hypothetical protein